MTRLLGIDTAAGACSVALWTDGAILDRSEEIERGHAERLLPMVLAVMAEAGAALSTIDAVAVTVGPGAFTGLRIGLAAARGIALAAGVPCFGVTTLEAIADDVEAWRRTHATCRDLPLVVALDTKRRDFYGQAFASGAAPLIAPRVGSAEQLAAAVDGDVVLVAGDGAPAVAAAITAGGRQGTVVEACRLPSAAAVVRLAGRRWQAGERPTAPPSPLYLRAADTGPPLAGPPLAGASSVAGQ